MTALRVLHVDDEPDIREVVEISLGLDPDFVTRSCGSGHEALEAVVDWQPDIILLDVMMPAMDGPATLARLQDNAKTANIPVVFMTACAQTHEVNLFRSLGAAGVISKPFDPMTLAASVHTFVRPAEDRSEALQAVFRRRIHSDAAALAEHQAVLKGGTAAPTTLVGIRDLAHGLAGAGGIFGFPEISAAAAALEDAATIESPECSSIEDVVSALENLLACLTPKSTCHDQTSASRLDA